LLNKENNSKSIYENKWHYHNIYQEAMLSHPHLSLFWTIKDYNGDFLEFPFQQASGLPNEKEFKNIAWWCFASSITGVVGFFLPLSIAPKIMAQIT